jgi:hypothetical protein
LRANRHAAQYLLDHIPVDVIGIEEGGGDVRDLERLLDETNWSAEKGRRGN